MITKILLPGTFPTTVCCSTSTKRDPNYETHFKSLSQFCEMVRLYCLFWTKMTGQANKKNVLEASLSLGA